jgi:hypothetical protein
MFRLIYATVHFDNRSDKISWLGNTRTWHTPLKDVLFGLQTWTGDAILVLEATFDCRLPFWLTKRSRYTGVILYGKGHIGRPLFPLSPT